MEKTNVVDEKKSSVKSPVTSTISTKPCLTTKVSKTKMFDDFKKILEKLKTEFEEVYKKKIESTCQLSDFDLLSTLGTGSFGSVILARMKTTNKYHAVKLMVKAQIIKNKQIEHTMNEKEVLQAVKFNFIIHLDYCFKDTCNVYFVLPYIPGGDMFSYLRRVRYLKEKDAKFYAAQILLALEYLHYLDLIYRDLKPENIVIDAPGYLKLTDLGFCKMVKTRTYTLCGTPEYLAPEIILSKGYGKYVDWWSFGIFIYEMLAGYTPFFANELMQIYEKITYGKFKFPPSFSQDARNLIKNMLQTDLSKRYGNLKNGIMDIKTHEWFKMVDWQAIYNRKAAAPFVPKISGPEDTTYFDKFDEIHIKESVTDKFTKEFENF